MKFFNKMDFMSDSSDAYILSFEDAAAAANAKLEREGKVVYGINGKVWGHAGNDDVGFKLVSFNGEPSTHKALLINIGPIEKCKHPKEKVRWVENCFGANGYKFQCSCGAKVVASEFREI